MSKIPTNFDVVSKEPPKAASGENFFSNPQLDPYETPIPEGKDWNASNTTGPEETNKAQPYKTKGSGYTG